MVQAALVKAINQMRAFVIYFEECCNRGEFDFDVVDTTCPDCQQAELNQSLERQQYGADHEKCQQAPEEGTAFPQEGCFQHIAIKMGKCGNNG